MEDVGTNSGDVCGRRRRDLHDGDGSGLGLRLEREKSISPHFMRRIGETEEESNKGDCESNMRNMGGLAQRRRVVGGNVQIPIAKT